MSFEPSVSVLKLDSVSKRFPGVTALSGVSFDVRSGEIHALVGENGAGKSTLINILTGVFPPDSGSIVIDDKRATLSSPRMARNLGIVAVHQEAELFPALSVAENLALLYGLPTNRWGVVDWTAVRRQAAATAALCLRKVDVRMPAGSLTIAERHLLEIAHAVATKARFVILDEPTSSLSGGEARWLFDQLRALRDRAVGIVYISHRQEEVFALADRISVLRDGKNVWTRSRAEVDGSALLQAMIGRESVARRPRRRSDDALAMSQGVVLAVKELTDPAGRFFQVSFSLRAGEVVGLYGLVGAGRTELAHALFGLRKYTGVIELAGAAYEPSGARDAIDKGLTYLPEDRLRDGIFAGLSIRFNIVLSNLKHYALGSIVRRGREYESARQQAAALSVRSRSIRQAIGQLSGGNQQKAVLGRALLAKPLVLILDEPTRGVDVAAKAEIHELIRRQADAGAAVLFISSDLPEIVSESDRVLVFREGRVAAEFEGGDIVESRIAEAALVGQQTAATRGPETAVEAPSVWRFVTSEVSLTAAIVLLAVLLSQTSAAFLSSSNIVGVLSGASVWAVLSLGVAFVILTGGIDISIGAIAALAAGVAAAVMQAQLPGSLATFLGILGGLATGAACGFLNGALAHVGRIHPIVVTLGMLTVYRGLLRSIFASGGWTILTDLPQEFRVISIGSVFGISGAMTAAFILTAFCQLFLSHSRPGRYCYAVGGNPSAARFAGIPQSGIRLLAFTLCGLLSACAGLLELSRNGSMQATLGANYELRAITAAVIGGVAVTGGRGTALGAALGALLLSLIQNALVLWQAPAIYYDLFVGSLLLCAVMFDALLKRKAQD